jgi:hypothetical protein
MTATQTSTPVTEKRAAPDAEVGERRPVAHVFGALSGAFYVVLIVVGNGLYTEGTNTGLGFGIEMLGYVALASFLAYVTTTLRGPRPWAVTLTLIGGVSMLAMKLSGWAAVLATTQSEVASDTAAALTLIDESAFVLGWLPHGLFVIGLAAAAVMAGRLPAWLGWVGAVLGSAEIAAVVVLTDEPTVIPYLLALLWIIAASIVLAVRGRRRDSTWSVEV